jgi:hypothetical protein
VCLPDYMLPLTLQRSVSLSKTTHISLTDVLNTLHNPVLLVNLSPLVVDHTVDPSETDLHHVTDKISILGFFPTRTKFTVKFTLVEDGVISSVDAGFGTVVKSQWRARTITGGGTEILEESSVKVSTRTQDIV